MWSIFKRSKKRERRYVVREGGLITPGDYYQWLVKLHLRPVLTQRAFNKLPGELKALFEEEKKATS